MKILPPLRQQFEAHCHLCGMVRYLYCTERAVRTLRPLTCTRCTTGRLFVERGDMGSLHGPQFDLSQTGALTCAWCRHLFVLVQEQREVRYCTEVCRKAAWNKRRRLARR